MTDKILSWIGKPKTVYTNNISYLARELCFLYVVADVIRMVLF